MSENPVLKTVERMNAGLASFFWDAFIALNVNGISGDYVEFGSWGGNTVNHAYHAIHDAGVPRHLWAYDSFEGFPELTDERDRRWVGYTGSHGGGVAEFHETCAQNGVPRDAYTVTAGFFEDTLRPLGTDGQPRDIALAYVDCNMYASTKTVFDFLKPRLKHGMIVGFDDYYCYSSTAIAGERIALHEFLAENPEWNFCRFKDIHWCGLGFVVERASDLPMLPGGRVTL
jgi:hypothetical protein